LSFSTEDIGAKYFVRITLKRQIMKKNIFAIALLSALTSTAMAEGLYAAIDVGQSTAKDACTGIPAGFSCNEKATAFRFGGGYQFTPNFGIEANYGILGAIKASGNDTTSIPGTPIAMSIDAKPSTLQVAATGNFPISDSFSLIGRLGIARTTLKVNGSGSALGVTVTVPEQSTTSTNLAYGIGAQVDLSKSVGIRAQYENFGEVGDVNSTTKISMISAGVVLKF
jgi:OOP family OmpA-OmpF porin